MFSGRLPVADARCHQTRGQTGERAQRRGPGLVGDGGQLGHCLRGFVGAVLLEACADHQLQRRRALGPIRRRQTPQVPLGEIGTALEIAAIEGHARASERRQRMGSTAFEQGHRLVEFSLAAPQLAQPYESFARHRRAGVRELVGGGRQLALGLFPRAPPHAHRRVLGAADGKERPQSPLRAERLEAIAPLDRALVIADALAGGDQIAAGDPDHDPVGHFTGQHGGVHLVELLQSFGHAPGRHPREAVERTSDHLEVGGAERVPDSNRFGRELLGPPRIAIVEQRKDAAAQREPRVFRGFGTALEEAMRALQPTVCHRVLAAERRRVPGQPHRNPRGSERIVALAINAVGALPHIEDDVSEIEPPGGETQSFERLGLFLYLKRRFKCQASRLPISAIERRTAGVETVDRSHHGTARSRRESSVFHDGQLGTGYLDGKDGGPRGHVRCRERHRWTPARNRGPDP